MKNAGRWCCPAMLVTLLSLVVFSSACAAASSPNIVFIFSDDHAYQSISAYGSVVNKTPNIDRIRAAGCPLRPVLCHQLCLRPKPRLHSFRQV